MSYLCPHVNIDVLEIIHFIYKNQIHTLCISMGCRLTLLCDAVEVCVPVCTHTLLRGADLEIVCSQSLFLGQLFGAGL